MQTNENSVKCGWFSLKIAILWKITENVTTHHQIVRFGSFLDMLALATSRIDFCVKILIFSFFSEKSRIFSQNLPKSIFFGKFLGSFSGMIHLNLLASLLSKLFTELKNNRVSRFYGHSSAPRYVRKSHFSYIKPYVKMTQKWHFWG